MKNQSELLLEKARKVFIQLYNQGNSINQINEIAIGLTIIGKEAIDNPKNTIGAISNGKLITGN